MKERGADTETNIYRGKERDRAEEGNVEEGVLCDAKQRT